MSNRSIFYCIIFLIIILFVGFCNSFQNTTWGGWTPPSTELKLSHEEEKWRRNCEMKYNCKFSFIGLDGSYNEDSIIYVNIDSEENSILQKYLNEDAQDLSLQFTKSFPKNSKNRINQKYIEYSFYDVYLKSEDQLVSQAPIKIKCLVNIKKGEIF